jgi:DNA-binding transcriptional ArsR family regulator
VIQSALREIRFRFPTLLPPWRLNEQGLWGIMMSKQLIANAESAAALLTLLGNEKRLVIVSHLLDGEMSVGAIAEKVSLSQSALSQHLAKLRSVNLVETRRDRQMIYYSCRSEAVRQLLGTLDGIFNFKANGKHPERMEAMAET